MRSNRTRRRRNPRERNHSERKESRRKDGAGQGRSPGGAADGPSLPAPDWGFLLRALLLMAVLSAAYYYPHAEGSAAARCIEAYLSAQARGAALLLGLFDPSVRAHDTWIEGRFPLHMVRSCSSLDAQVLYAASVAAFPAAPWMRACGVLAGASALTALNVARVAGLYLVGSGAPELFDAVHEELFPVLLVGFACLGFGLWARWASRAMGRR